LAKLAERYADQPKEHSSNKRRSAFASIEWPSLAAGKRVYVWHEAESYSAHPGRLSARDYLRAITFWLANGIFGKPKATYRTGCFYNLKGIKSTF